MNFELNIYQNYDRSGNAVKDYNNRFIIKFTSYIKESYTKLKVLISYKFLTECEANFNRMKVSIFTIVNLDQIYMYITIMERLLLLIVVNIHNLWTRLQLFTFTKFRPRKCHFIDDIAD